MRTMRVRPPAVAGLFYPADPSELESDVETFLEEGPAGSGPVPKAIDPE
jgi:MEMO1 family protein